MGTLKVEKYYANTGLALREGLEVGLSFSSASKEFEGGFWVYTSALQTQTLPHGGCLKVMLGRRGERL